MSNSYFYERRNPEWYADDFRRELEIADDIAVNLDCIIDALDIHVKLAPIKKGILGACKVRGLKKLIVISPDIYYNAQKRFTIAHEIGHLIIHHGVHFCRAEDFKMLVNTKTKEKEANRFAAQLLLPRNVVINRLRRGDVSLDMAQELSKLYEISLSSAILRMIELSDENVAIFYQKNNIIQWTMKSTECRSALASGMISSRSLSYLVSLNNPRQEGYVDPGAWFEDNPFIQDIRCYEQTWYFSKLNMKLSVVRLELEDY